VHQNGKNTKKRTAKAAAKILGTTVANVKKALVLGPRPPHSLLWKQTWAR
jgi:hypothetical protein